MRERVFYDKNYHGIFINNKTIRIPINMKEPILELDYPEFYDISITNHCMGNCNYCYQNSLDSNGHYDKIIKKVNSFFGKMTFNERPFQVAIGGGEPTTHPDFLELLKTFKKLEIVPNYTTNGMWIDDESADDIVEYTSKYCGGVALSTHKHLTKYWKNAANALISNNVFVNFHIIISDKKSIDEFVEIYDKWHDKIRYFVLLPYVAIGRAEHKNIEYAYLYEKLPEKLFKVAFGANFYGWLKNTPLELFLYDPEMYSKYLSLKDNGYLYPSSFSNKILKKDFLL